MAPDGHARRKRFGNISEFIAGSPTSSVNRGQTLFALRKNTSGTCSLSSTSWYHSSYYRCRQQGSDSVSEPCQDHLSRKWTRSKQLGTASIVMRSKANSSFKVRSL